MKAQSIRSVVEETSARLDSEKISSIKSRVAGRKPADLVTQERMSLRQTRLKDADFIPSPVAFERILGTSDLLDVNYLLRGLTAARSVCRVILRDRFGREVGYGTGFKVAPGLLMTNHHVLESAAVAQEALAEFDYELDVTGCPRAVTRFALNPQVFFLNDSGLDFALVAISQTPLHGSGRLDDYGFLRLVADEGKVNPGEYVTVIQHPGGQPKQIALRENELLQIEPLVLWYQSDTAQGSSGSPVFNDSWQIVALHHSGVPKKDAQGNWLLKNGQPAGPDADDSDIDWLANEGIRASRIVSFVEGNAAGVPLVGQFLRAVRGEVLSAPAVPGLNEPQPVTQPETSRSQPETIVPDMTGTGLPLSLTITIGGAGVPSGENVMPSKEHPPALAQEKTRTPVIDADYGSRKGYDPRFLGIEVPLPAVVDEHDAVRLDDGSHVLLYEHFSVVMAKNRRMALFTAANIDSRPESRKPEPGRDYSRRGLGGFGRSDRELWLMDPRIPEMYQLPDRFYTRDGGAFDKGHIVKREDVCWGTTYEEVQRANGDTYHMTNCSPQVADFNQASRGGLWGRLEDFILSQSRSQTYSVMAGPLLQARDREFIGVDQRGQTRIRIPSAYWKIVVATVGSETRSFAFLLEQDLSQVPLEMAVTAEWLESMVSITDLEKWIASIEFPDVLKDTDQFETHVGTEMLGAEALRGLAKGRIRNESLRL